MIFMSRAYSLLLLLLAGITSGSTQHHFLKWSRPATSPLVKRQSGYHPEAGPCGDGDTCVEACGNNYETCPANTDLVLFCFNPKAGQKCCGNYDGRACDAGYYCARDGSNKTWCCATGLDIVQCAQEYGVTSLFTDAPTGSSTLPPVAEETTSALVTTTSDLLSTVTEAPSINTTVPNNRNGTIVTATGSRRIGSIGTHTLLGCLLTIILVPIIGTL
ncbi:hypothetical protein QBC43DRAFT_374232 [Cladorrhinum sp. PSN259]|nr:hypothetical protein QBC43DRAFT_374232 [Cladorrhinum sp. PSN259]